MMVDLATPPRIGDAPPMPTAQTMTGGEALVAALLAQGVDTLFGLPGVQLDGFFSALHDGHGSIRVFHTRHEQAAAYMADGYARVSGREGVCAVVPGPGVLNAAAGLATAYACNSPVLCITGQIRSDLIDTGRGALHEIPNQLGMLRSVTKHAARAATLDAIPHVVDEAFRQLRSGRSRPVAIEIPPDILLGSGEVSLLPPAPARQRPTGDPETIARAARVLGAATSPVILAGGGVLRSGASDELLHLAEVLQAPVIVSCNARGVISDRHHLAHSPVAASGLLPGADVLLVVGTRFPHVSEPERSFATFCPGQTVIHLDIEEREFGRFAPGTIDIHADAKIGLAALYHRLERQGRRRPSRRDELSALKEDVRARLNAIEPQAGFALAIRAETPDDGIIVSELTQVGHWSCLGLPVYAPNTFLTAGYQGTLGYGFATAMGAKIARPDVPVVSINGDGGFGYSMNELATLVQHNIPLIAVVFNDNAYGNVRRMQREDHGGRLIATDLVNPDYGVLAAAFGISARRAETPESLRVQVREAIRANEPTLIEVPVGPMPNPWKALAQA
ncbi:MAG: thiamine pyrophosphate-binding protein [Thermomicrobiales bacterium]